MNFSLPAPVRPCVKIGLMYPIHGFCMGRGRTIAEIPLWSEMSMSGLPERTAGARSRCARGGHVGSRPRS
jgi:predicted Fe-S protein YdhL (DUF1289 family)